MDVNNIFVLACTAEKIKYICWVRCTSWSDDLQSKNKKSIPLTKQGRRRRNFRRSCESRCYLKGLEGVVPECADHSTRRQQRLSSGCPNTLLYSVLIPGQHMSTDALVLINGIDTYKRSWTSLGFDVPVEFWMRKEHALWPAYIVGTLFTILLCVRAPEPWGLKR